jgi:hypothetical protein
MKKITLGTLMILAMLFVIAPATTSCGKVKDSLAKVTVVDKVTGQPMNGVTVTLRPISSETPPRTDFIFTSVEAQTDAKGVATFNMSEYYEAGQAGLMVLTIDAAGQTDVGIIKIEEQVTNEKTVEI